MGLKDDLEASLIATLGKWEDSDYAEAVVNSPYYVMWPADDDKIILDGAFTTDDLRELLAFMEARR